MDYTMNVGMSDGTSKSVPFSIPITTNGIGRLVEFTENYQQTLSVAMQERFGYTIQSGKPTLIRLFTATSNVGSYLRVYAGLTPPELQTFMADITITPDGFVGGVILYPYYNVSNGVPITTISSRVTTTTSTFSISASSFVDPIMVCCYIMELTGL